MDEIWHRLDIMPCSVSVKKLSPATYVSDCHHDLAIYLQAELDALVELGAYDRGTISIRHLSRPVWDCCGGRRRAYGRSAEEAARNFVENLKH